MARAAGVQEIIPALRKATPRPIVERWTLLLRHKNRLLIEHRPADGRWAGLWQFVTIEPSRDLAPADRFSAEIGVTITGLAWIGYIAHALTHRRYRFDVFTCDVRDEVPVKLAPSRRWVSLTELAEFPLPRPHLKIAELLRER